ncbi:dihydrolipoyl dehydrogenase family protein [Actinacidiphila bryophytorum]|uniref:dihydrolipoyl dehydrogenase family protein n=1 Tax=Actinacidiphila bryophytorum TaxID=1436133 RepID=UPI002176CD51|nr:NAD(P)/FAD-dependent oxidoreductase [Actinacidiphila bryophytorum]UWE09163.1 NAD(P)/FAD-dependent oxidoreductase [Actinacidiphila bryophytorum]
MTANTEDQQHLSADVLVVGFGKGGKTAARALGGAGKTVVLVEESARMYGGTCPNVGCVPSKGMVHHSRKRRPQDDPQRFYEQSVDKVQDVREFMRQGNYDGLTGVESVTVVTGKAVFTDPHTVAVSKADGGRLTVTAETVLVNTGSRPVVPDTPGLRASRFLLTSTELLESRHLPQRLAIIGGGYLGLEFAAIYQRFGSRVTMLARGERFLPRADADVAEAVRTILGGEGVTIVTGAQVREVRDGQDDTTVVYDAGGTEHTLTVDAVLPATGRVPATDGLGLESAGVRTAKDGAIEVDEHLRTSQPHIFALGDVNGGPKFTYISLDDSRIVLDQLLGEGQRTTADRGAVPNTVFMTPPLATVGLTEQEARAAGHRIKVARENVEDILAMPRAYAVEETRGLMKFVIDADTDLILGAALLSVDAQELINTVTLAIRHRITATELRNTIYTHPSSTEAFNEAPRTIIHEDPPTGQH